MRGRSTNPEPGTAVAKQVGGSTTSVLGMVKRAEEYLAKIPFLSTEDIRDFLASAQQEVLVCSIQILRQHFKQSTMNSLAPYVVI